MMIDMVDQHILVHGDGNGSTSIEANHKYYLSRSGAPVIVDNMGNVNNGSGMVVEGGYQRMSTMMLMAKLTTLSVR